MPILTTCFTCKPHQFVPKFNRTENCQKNHCNVFFIWNLLWQLPFAFSLFANFCKSLLCRLLVFSLNEFCPHSLRSIYCPSFVVNECYKWSQMIHEWSANKKKIRLFFLMINWHKNFSFLSKDFAEEILSFFVMSRRKIISMGNHLIVFFFRYFLKFIFFRWM